MYTDTYKDLEEVLVDYIHALGNVPPDSEQARLIAARVEQLFKLLTEQDKVENKKAFDEAAQKLEEEKNTLNVQKVIMDLTKIFGPALLSIIAYAILQKRLLKFEETGRICTNAGREFHLPRFWK